jgi:hypothetical protein
VVPAQRRVAVTIDAPCASEVVDTSNDWAWEQELPEALVDDTPTLPDVPAVVTGRRVSRNARGRRFKRQVLPVVTTGLAVALVAVLVVRTTRALRDDLVRDRVRADDAPAVASTVTTIAASSTTMLPTTTTSTTTPPSPPSAPSSSPPTSAPAPPPRSGPLDLLLGR